MRRKERPLPPAPGGLRIVQAFLNTVDRKAGTDELTTPRASQRRARRRWKKILA